MFVFIVYSVFINLGIELNNKSVPGNSRQFQAPFLEILVSVNNHRADMEFVTDAPILYELNLISSCNTLL